MNSRRWASSRQTNHQFSFLLFRMGRKVKLMDLIAVGCPREWMNEDNWWMWMKSIGGMVSFLAENKPNKPQYKNFSFWWRQPLFEWWKQSLSSLFDWWVMGWWASQWLRQEKRTRRREIDWFMKTKPIKSSAVCLRRQQLVEWMNKFICSWMKLMLRRRREDKQAAPQAARSSAVSEMKWNPIKWRVLKAIIWWMKWNGGHQRQTNGGL